MKKNKKTILPHSDLVIIGASTGGPFALINLLKSLKKITFPIIIVQHMHEAYTKDLATILHLETGHKVIEGYHNLIVQSKHIVICRGGVDAQVYFENNDFVLKEIEFSDHLPHPSIDVLFESAACLDKNITGIILTGMGNDGCKGSKKLLDTNKIVIAQDPQTCLAENMPNAAIDQGNVSHVLTLPQIASYLKI
ncbi:MAG: chemotaxis protein CheB [Alphaproteobacteria bacterium]|nr:chemotaxis protein CheB [Alphaproteobacteria bacterium]